MVRLVMIKIIFWDWGFVILHFCSPHLMISYTVMECLVEEVDGFRIPYFLEVSLEKKGTFFFYF